MAETWSAPRPKELTSPPTLGHFSADQPIEEIAEGLEQDGVVIVEGVLDHEMLDVLNAELDPHLVAEDAGREAFVTPEAADFAGEHMRAVHSLAAKCPSFGRLAIHPTLLGICDHVLLPHCGNYQLNLAVVLDRGLGDPAQPLHRDDDQWGYVSRPCHELLVSSMTALVDFSLDNGATLVVPGSHRWERERKPEAQEVGVASMPAGSTLIFLGSVIHGGGANLRPERRRGLNLSYLLGWLRAEECMQLSAPPNVARSLPRRLQELLGYGAHIAPGGSYLGGVENCNPVELLERGRLG